MRRVVIASMLALFSAPTLSDELGEQLFVDNCSACHQLEGVGQPGVAPPLADPQLWAGLGDNAQHYISGVLMGGMYGTIEAKGEIYEGLAMPPQDWMSDEEMVAVADYVLNALNDQEIEVAADTFAKARQNRISHGELRALRKEAIE